VRDPAGRLSGALYNRVSGVTESYSVTQFEREDAMTFSLRPDVLDAGYVSEGDTIGDINSTILNRRLAELYGQLEVENAGLALALSSDKASVIEEAQQRIRYAEEQVEAQDRVVTRLRALVERNVSSVAELEIEEDKLQLFRTEVVIAEAALETVLSGERVEEVAFARAQIGALEREITALREQEGAYTVVTPIAGRVRPMISADTLFTVSDTSHSVVFLPVRTEERKFVNVGQRVTLSQNGGAPYEARITRTEARVRHVAGVEVVVYSGTIESVGDYDLIPGMGVQAEIHCGDVRLREYIRRHLGPFLGMNGA